MRVSASPKWVNFYAFPKIILSGDELSLFRSLHCLRPPPRRELVEHAACVRLDGVLTYVESPGDFAIAQPRGQRLQNFELSRGDPQLSHLFFVADERTGYVHGNLHFNRYGHFPHNDSFASTREFEPEPDAEAGKHYRDESAVNLERMLEDEEAVLDEIERGNEQPAKDAVDEDYLLHALNVRAPRRTAKAPGRQS